MVARKAEGAAFLPRLEPLEPRILLSAVSLVPPGLESYTPMDWSCVVGKPVGRLAAKAPSDDIANTFAAAKVLSLSRLTGSGSLGATINYAGDVDMIRVVATKTGTMTVTESPSGTQSNVSADLSVYDGSRSLLGRDSDGATRGATLSIQVTAGQTYYIQAGALDGTTGKYTVQVAIADPPAPPPPPEPPPPPPEPPPPPSRQPGATVTGYIETLSGGPTLIVLGTDGADRITLSQSGQSVTLVTASGSMTFDGFLAAIQVYAFGGDDVVRITYTMALPSTVLGGDGADQIFEAGPGAAQLSGDAGDDLLVAVGGGADAVSGGAGLDSFWVDSSDTIADAGPAETAAATVHRIAAFYQPTSDTASRPSLEMAGQNLVDPAASGTYVNYSSTPLFTDGPQYDDARQGSVADCYFLAALSSLAQADPDRIRQMIAPLGDGTFAVRFHRNGQESYLRVDADLTLTGAQLTPDGELWVALAEKAYAQFRTGQNSYASLNYGWMSTVYIEVTNQATGDYSPSGMSNDALAAFISGNLAAGHALSAGSYPSPVSPIVGNHAYVVQSLQNVGGQWYVTVYNVWGYDGRSWDSNYGDGLLQIPMGTFRQAFTDLAVSLA